MLEVRIDTATLVRLGNEIHAGMHVLRKLREAGVPATGVLFPTGVESGVLSMHDDVTFGETVYTWNPETPE